ncbi:MAG: MBL fold metallo-hydrolase [Lewinella sp.]|nr:MBL fold metallo-hydrolase [Lewinella sp.]
MTFLGTGTSQGVPVIGCTCEVCRSDDPHDKRLRTSILISSESTNIVIDCGPDFRQQMLRENVDHLEAVVLTHEHNDHIIGMDDVRPFNFQKREDMPVYASDRVAKELHTRFAYVFAENPYPGAPMLKLHHISRATGFTIHDLELTPIEVQHGSIPVLGFRIGPFTYITDMKNISDQEKEKVKGSRYLVVNALHHQEHHSHLNLREALAFIREIAPERALLTHMSHRMGIHQEVNRTLPAGVELAYDGLILGMRNEE